MTVQLYAFECGRVTIPLGFMIAGESGPITVPVPSYLLVHERGKVVFDTGLNIVTQTDVESYMPEAGLSFTTFHAEPGSDISARLKSVDVDPSSIDLIVNSHLHYDHSGGNALLPEADVMVNTLEWDHAQSCPPDDLAYRNLDFDTGQHVRLIDGDHDVFGDGTAVVFPTPGHTSGHQSMKVRTDSGEFVLCGDACYMCRSLDDDLLPGIIDDADAARATFEVLRGLRRGGATILFGHDPEMFASLELAPARLG